MNPASLRPDLCGIGGRALREVLFTQLSLAVTAVPPVPPAPDEPDVPRFHGSVSLNGDRLSGDVQLEIPGSFVLVAAGRLLPDLGLEDPADPRLDDLAGELCNMIAGRVAASLRQEGFAAVLSPPVVVRASRPPPGPGRGKRTLPHQLVVPGARSRARNPMPLPADMTPKILSVDDSKTIRLLLARLFRPFVCEFFAASNGEEGLAIAAEKRPDLIVLDYNMPVMDGIAMLRLLREDPALRRTPVIMLTAESGCENMAVVARLGVRDYLTKPFREEQLLAKVGRIVPLLPRPDEPVAPSGPPPMP